MHNVDPDRDTIESETQTRAISALLSNRIGSEEPGAAIGVYRDGRLVSFATRGLASLEFGVEITDETLFDIASCSKQMTAALMLVLSRDGLVDLDADVRAVVPELRLAGITLRGCLRHTSGLRDYLTTCTMAGRSLSEVATADEFIDLLGRMEGTDFAPGSDVSYSNTGYVLAAAVVARVLDAPFAETLATRIFEPLGMYRTGVRDAVGKVIPGMAVSYQRVEGRGFVREEMVEAQVGDGAVVTSLSDLARWQGFLLDGRVLGADIREELVRPAVLTGGGSTSYGHGIQLNHVDEVPAILHHGSMWGYRSALICLPSLGLGAAVLSNRGDVECDPLIRSTVAAVLERHTDEQPEGSAPNGTWFSSDHIDCFRVTNGRLPKRLEDAVATPDGDGLLVRDSMGGEIHYTRIDQHSATAPIVVSGRFLLAEPPGDIVVESGAGGARAMIGRAQPLSLTFAGRDGDCDIYYQPDCDGWEACTAVFHGASAGDKTLSVRMGGPVFRSLPRG